MKKVKCQPKTIPRNSYYCSVIRFVWLLFSICLNIKTSEREVRGNVSENDSQLLSLYILHCSGISLSKVQRCTKVKVTNFLVAHGLWENSKPLWHIWWRIITYRAPAGWRSWWLNQPRASPRPIPPPSPSRHSVVQTITFSSVVESEKLADNPERKSTVSGPYNAPPAAHHPTTTKGPCALLCITLCLKIFFTEMAGQPPKLWWNQTFFQTNHRADAWGVPPHPTKHCRLSLWMHTVQCPSTY